MSEYYKHKTIIICKKTGRKRIQFKKEERPPIIAEPKKPKITKKWKIKF